MHNPRFPPPLANLLTLEAAKHPKGRFIYRWKGEEEERTKGKPFLRPLPFLWQKLDLSLSPLPFLEPAQSAENWLQKHIYKINEVPLKCTQPLTLLPLVPPPPFFHPGGKRRMEREGLRLIPRKKRAKKPLTTTTSLSLLLFSHLIMSRGRERGWSGWDGPESRVQ